MSFHSEDRRKLFLREMGIGPVWVKRDAENTAPATPLAGPESALKVAPVGQDFFEAPTTGTAPPAPEVSHMDWTQLKSVVSACVKCDLCRGRTQTVFGVGDEKAKWLFVGEAPGRNEDLQGEPFVGQAGKLLDNMLAAMELRRGENAYIANIVKCRPTDASGKDRPPTQEEAEACLPYLHRQIALIQPAVIVALGKTAALSLLNLDADTPVSRLRGTVHRYQELPVVVTYHPAYLLRNTADKKKTWSDLCLAMATYGGKA